MWRCVSTEGLHAHTCMLVVCVMLHVLSVHAKMSCDVVDILPLAGLYYTACCGLCSLLSRQRAGGSACTLHRDVCGQLQTEQQCGAHELIGGRLQRGAVACFQLVGCGDITLLQLLYNRIPSGCRLWQANMCPVSCTQVCLRLTIAAICITSLYMRLCVLERA